MEFNFILRDLYPLAIQKALCSSNVNLYPLFHPDRLIFHDQPVPGGHRYPVLGDQTAGTPANAGTKGAVPLLLHPGQHGRAGRLLRGDLPTGLPCPPQS